MTDTLKCSKCQLVKPRTEFYKQGNRLTSNCKTCISVRAKRYYLNNADNVKSKALSYYYDNHEYYSNKKYRRPKNMERRRAEDSRRRAKIKVNMSKEDKQLSVAYRKAIKYDSCFYCGKTNEIMHDDHFFPLAKGGTDHWWNLVRACPTCNIIKGAHCGTYFMLKR